MRARAFTQNNFTFIIICDIVFRVFEKLMAKTAVKLTSIFGKAVKPEGTPQVPDASSQTCKIEGYELIECLGSGGMGTVYKAHDEKLDRVVALKLMLKDLRADPAVHEAFKREARAIAKLNHPNIAQIHSFGENSGKSFIVMEYVPGTHFSDLVFSPNQLDQSMVMKTGMEIACGLQVAADAGLVHGDIKPENIVFDDRGVPKLLDFGIASASNAKTTEIWGTPYYIAPEKLKKQRVDFRSDMYCLGGTLYHALTKHPPFDGDDVRAVLRARLAFPPEPMSSYRADIDPEVEAIVSRMLQIDPADRYPTYGALIADIRKYLRRVNPKALGADDMYVAEENTVTKKSRTPFFHDFKSQLILLLTLIAIFPYFLFFYNKDVLVGRGLSERNATEIHKVSKAHKMSAVPGDAKVTGAAGTNMIADVHETNGAVMQVSEKQTERTPVVKHDPGLVVAATTNVIKQVADLHSEVALVASSTEVEKKAPPLLEKQQLPAPAVQKAGAPTPSDEVIDLTGSGNVSPNVKWPSLKITAVAGDGDNGSAIVNGEIVSAGYSFGPGIILRAVEPMSAIFEWKGQLKRVYVSRPVPKNQHQKNQSQKKK